MELFNIENGIDASSTLHVDSCFSSETLYGMHFLNQLALDVQEKSCITYK